MRPTSRGMAGRPPGSAAGMAPSTGMARPGSSRLMTGRLRTGTTPAGAGTQAGQGLALNMNVNIQDRPVTGQGMVGMKVQNNFGRIVEDNAYYVGLLRKKINDINQETKRLETLIESNTKESAALGNLEKKHDSLLKSKETLEGQLADYNLALDKTRTSTDPDDVRLNAQHLLEKNKQTGQELDRIFSLRKERELEIQRIEESIETFHQEIERRINDLDPQKLRIYHDLSMKQKEFQSKITNSDTKLQEIYTKIDTLENDSKSNPYRKEYLALDKLYYTLRHDIESLETELDISNLDPKEAHTKFVTRVNEYKNQTKGVDEKIGSLRDEMTQLRKKANDLDYRMNNDTNATEELQEQEQLLAQEQEINEFMITYDTTVNEIYTQHDQSKEIIVTLLENISLQLEEESLSNASKNNSGNTDVKGFKEKNLLTQQQTMEELKNERKKRQKELDMLKASEPKLVHELTAMKENIQHMKSEMILFQDMDALHHTFNELKDKLLLTKQSYINRRDNIKQQIAKVANENESFRKELSSNETAKELDDTEKRLKHNERTIFELKEYVDTKTREIEYEPMKLTCIAMINNLNSIAVKKCSFAPSPVPGSNNSIGLQAKW